VFRLVRTDGSPSDAALRFGAARLTVVLVCVVVLAVAGLAAGCGGDGEPDTSAVSETSALSQDTAAASTVSASMSHDDFLAALADLCGRDREVMAPHLARLGNLATDDYVGLADALEEGMTRRVIAALRRRDAEVINRLYKAQPDVVKAEDKALASIGTTQCG
jgi:hypothetical protein